MKRIVHYLLTGINLIVTLLIVNTSFGQVRLIPAELSNPSLNVNIELPSEKATTTSLPIMKNMAATPHPGKWEATTGTGFGFEFTVNDAATSITQLKLIFNDWKCGIVTRNGSITVTSKWGISSQTFSIVLPDLNGAKYEISGVFNNNSIEATGTWDMESDNGNCSGTWNAEPETIFPDLTVTSIDFSPVSGSTGDKININVTVKNNSITNAGSSILNYYLSINDNISDMDIHIGTNTVPALAGGESSEESLSWLVPESLAAGQYYVGAIVDANSQVTEYNETNDFCLADPKFEKLEDALPDLILTVGGFDPYEGGIGTNLNVYATIQNIGLEKAEASSLAIYLCVDPEQSVEDYYIQSAQIPELSPGASMDTQITWEVDSTIPPGSYYIGYQVDANNDVEESDDWNYYFLPGSQFVRLPDPDLFVSSMDFSPSSGKTGDILNVNVILKNNDTGNSGKCAVSFYLSPDTIIADSDYLLGTSILPNLDGRKEALLETNWIIQSSLPEGEYYIGCIVDTENVVAESNEENNIYCIHTYQFKKDDPPMIVSFSPFGASQTTADARPELKITFNEEITEGEGCLKIYQTLSDGTDKLIREKECWEGKITEKSIEFRLSTSLDSFALHYVLIDSGFVKDLNENPFEGISEKSIWIFKTGNYPTGILPYTETQNIKIFPNPAFGAINIEISHVKAPFTVEIITIAGHMIVQKEIGSSPHKMRLNGLSKGIYLLKVSNQKFSKTKKIIIH